MNNAAHLINVCLLQLPVTIHAFVYLLRCACTRNLLCSCGQLINLEWAYITWTLLQIQLPHQLLLGTVSAHPELLHGSLACQIASGQHGCVLCMEGLPNESMKLSACCVSSHRCAGIGRCQSGGLICTITTCCKWSWFKSLPLRARSQSKAGIGTAHGSCGVAHEAAQPQQSCGLFW